MSITIIDNFKKFKPDQISDIYRWHDALDPDTFSEVGGKITQWDDKSGNSYHGTQTVDSLRPVAGTDPDTGRPSVDFTSGAVYLETSAPIVTEYTQFIVANRSTATSVGHTPGGMLDGLKVVQAFGLVFPNTGWDPDSVSLTSSAMRSGAANPPVPEESVIYSNVNVGTTYLLTSVMPSSGTGQILYIDNTQTGNSATKSNLLDLTGRRYNIGVGVWTAPNTPSALLPGYWPGHISEIVEYDRTLSDEERKIVRDHLLQKWGLPS